MNAEGCMKTDRSARMSTTLFAKLWFRLESVGLLLSETRLAFWPWNMDFQWQPEDSTGLAITGSVATLSLFSLNHFHIHLSPWQQQPDPKMEVTSDPNWMVTFLWSAGQSQENCCWFTMKTWNKSCFITLAGRVTIKNRFLSTLVSEVVHGEKDNHRVEGRQRKGQIIWAVP